MAASPMRRDQSGIVSTPVAGFTRDRTSRSNVLVDGLSGRYDQPFGSVKGFAQVNWQWRDKVSFSAAGDPNLVQDSFGLLNGSLGIASIDNRWTASVFVKNLFDTFYATNIISQPVLNAPGVYSQFYSPDSRRLIGVSVGLKLGR